MAEAYKIILVDDEDEVRGRISSKVSAESGFVVVGTAGNGYDALELIEREQPQVVITDIKMPYIDGIELARIIRRDFPTVRIGFITGFDEFDYARQAVELGVKSYLTKPLTQDDVAAFLRKLKAELDEEAREAYSRERLTKQYEQSLPLVIESCLGSIVASGSGGRPEDLALLRDYGVSLDDADYVVAFAVLERDPNRRGIVEHEQLKLAVRARLGSLLELGGLSYYRFPLHEGLAFVVKRSGASFESELDAALNRAARSCEQFMAVRMAVGVSAAHRDLRRLAKACEEASGALYAERFASLSPVSYYGQAGQREGEAPRLGEAEAAALERLLKLGSDEELAAALDALRSRTETAAEQGSPLAGFFLGLAGILAGYASSLGSDLAELCGEDPFSRLASLRSPALFFPWFAAMAAAARERSAAARASGAERALERALALMERRYGDSELSMDQVCGELAISPSYLSQLFRRLKGTSFVRHLTSLRIERAKELLSSTNELIVEVAARCGYKDVYYFSHSFKKYTGVPPKKYRDERG